jgi:hypothetical protein
MSANISARCKYCLYGISRPCVFVVVLLHLFRIFSVRWEEDRGRPVARTIRNGKLDTRSARSRLTLRREPYWTVISEGCALGYRRGAKGGTWIGRFSDEAGQQHYEALGAADDARDPDGLSVFSFA